MGLEFIDSHAHLYAEEFAEDLVAVIQRAKDKHVSQVLLPAIDSSTFDAMMAITSRFPDFFKPMMGLHPCSVKEDYKAELELVEKELASGQYCAVGEVGMDLYWDKSTKDIQEDAFRQQCQWAKDLDLPLAIHSRNSTREILDVLQDLKELELRGVFHCFSGTAAEAKELIDLGFYLGIGGVVTFKNSGLKDEIKDISLDHLLLETDSPYLAPVPYRGKRNESSYLDEIADFLANLYGCTKEEIGHKTSANTRALFGL